MPDASSSPQLPANASSSGQSSQQGRQFKDFVFTAEDERFHPQKKQRRERVKIACS
jgi:hypothetical protein